MSKSTPSNFNLREDPAEKNTVQTEFCQMAAQPHPPQANTRFVAPFSPKFGKFLKQRFVYVNGYFNNDNGQTLF